MIRSRLARLAALVALGVPAVVLVTSQTAGATMEFSVTEHDTNVEFVIQGHSTLQPPTGPLSPGDEVVFRSDLLQDGSNVGYVNGTCTVTFNDNTLCNVVFAFANKGDLMATTLLRGGATAQQPSVFDAAVTGGTFAYRNAHGDDHITGLSNGDNVDTFDLVTS